MGPKWAEVGSFVASLSDAAYETLEGLGRRRRFPKASTLFSEGDRSDRTLLLLDGRAKLSCFTDDGKEVLLALRGPGELLGDMSAIDDQPRSASAYAIEDVEALVIPREDFLGFLGSHPDVALTFIRMLAARLREADEKRIEFAAHDSVGRVASRLAELAIRYGEETAGGIRITAPLTQEELAGWTGASREAVSKALQTLRGRGWIETHRRGVTVKDLPALRRRAT